MDKIFRFTAMAFAATILTGCATTASLTPEQLAEKFPDVNKLSNEVATGEQNNLQILAPASYELAASALKDAQTAAERGQAENANSLAKSGLKAIEKARVDGNKSLGVMSEVVEARRRAEQAGASKLFVEEAAELESRAADLGRSIEKGNVESAKQDRPELQRAYLDIELRAIKEGTVTLAKAALDEARKNGAEDYAPKTYKLAVEEYTLAQQVLDTDRTRQDKANALATRATVLANRATNISELVKDFDRRDYSNEDIVLWYQDNIKSATAPLGKNIEFNEPNQSTINAVRADLSNLVGSLQDKEEKIATLSREVSTVTALREQEASSLREKYEGDIASVKQQFSRQIAQSESAQAAAERTRAEDKARLETVQSLFVDKEAEVYLQRRNVLISAHGFAFPSGKSEIETENFALLNKIAKAITSFQGAKIHISGHTDATGSEEINKSLSEKRAENVAKFLIEVSGISPDMIVTEGYGKERPLASNETNEGRAQNRRIEVLIENPK